MSSHPRLAATYRSTISIAALTMVMMIGAYGVVGVIWLLLPLVNTSMTFRAAALVGMLVLPQFGSGVCGGLFFGRDWKLPIVIGLFPLLVLVIVVWITGGPIWMIAESATLVAGILLGWVVVAWLGMILGSHFGSVGLIP